MMEPGEKNKRRFGHAIGRLGAEVTRYRGDVLGCLSHDSSQLVKPYIKMNCTKGQVDRVSGFVKHVCNDEVFSPESLRGDGAW